MEGWIAVGAFAAFVGVLFILNWIEFGRPD